MRRRYEAAKAAILPNLKFSPGSALRAELAHGYGKRDLIADALAGLVVGVVALPLAMALAIASGVPPQHGLYTSIIAGAVIALLGGSKVNVSGPTAAFVVILAPIAARFGLGGLLVATLMAGLMLVVMGLARMGRLIEFVPHPVTTGFTAGIAVVIATLQVKDFLGLTLAENPEHFLEKVAVIARALPSTQPGDLVVGLTTLAVLIGFPRVTQRVPAPLVGLIAGTIAALVVGQLAPGWSVATIGSKFSYLADGVRHPGIPAMPPVPVLPWHLPGGDGQPLVLSFSLIRTLAPSAFAIAMLGAIESLLCAVVADGMAGTKHDPDVELLAQGVGNLAAPFFGGIAATGAIARTATNIRAGARSPLASFFHAVFVLAAMLALAPLLGYLPMAALAALLLVVAYRMSEVHHFLHILRVAPRSDTIVLVVCFTLTVVFDMVVSVSIGIVLAALLFMRRMAEISRTSLTVEGHPGLAEPLPRGVFLYEIAGPLFFGAAQKAMSALETVRAPGRVVILDMSSVPAMDVTGLVALESAIDELEKTGHFVIIAGVQEQPRSVLARGGVEDVAGKRAVCATLEEAVELAKGKRRSTAQITASP
jgi:SulP family sulfate permease